MLSATIPLRPEVAGEYQLPYNFDGTEAVVYNCPTDLKGCHKLEPGTDYILDAQTLTVLPEAAFSGRVVPGFIYVFSHDVPMIFIDTQNVEPVYKVTLIFQADTTLHNVKIYPSITGPVPLTDRIFLSLDDVVYLKSIEVEELEPPVIVHVKIQTEGLEIPLGVFPMFDIILDYEEW